MKDEFEDGVTLDQLQKMEFPEYVVDEGDSFVLDDGAYPIEKYRIKSYRDIVDWVRQLSGKKWATREVIWEFVRKAIDHIGGTV